MRARTPDWGEICAEAEATQMKRDSEFVTIDELCRKYKCGFLVIQRRIELLRERGLVDECRVRRVRSDGREYWCDGYKLR